MHDYFKNLIPFGSEPHILVENGEPRFVVMPWREFEAMRAGARQPARDALTGERVRFAPTPENSTAPQGFLDSSSLLKQDRTDEQEKGASGRKSTVPFFGAGFAEVADEVLDAPVFAPMRRSFASLAVDTAKIRLEDLPV